MVSLLLAIAAAAISLSPRHAPQIAPPAAAAYAAARAPPPRARVVGRRHLGLSQDDGRRLHLSNANARSLLGEKTGSEAWLEVLLSTGRATSLAHLGHLGWTVAAATAFTGLLGAARGGYLPADVTAAVEGLTLPPLAHESVGTVIALLLAFRVQQAYERFWDGRELWASVYSDTRGLVRLASCVAAEAEGGSDGLGEADAVVALAAAWPYALKQHLRGELNEKELTDAADALLLTQDERLLMAVDIDTSALDGGEKKKGTKGAAQRKARRPQGAPAAAAGDAHVERRARHAARAGGGGAAAALARRPAVVAARQPRRRHDVDAREGGEDRIDAGAALVLAPRLALLLGEMWRQFGTRNSGAQFSAQFLCATDGVPIPSRLSTPQVYAFTLPLALASFSDQNLLLLPPVVAVVAWVLFATEEIGHIIEDPFGRGLAPDPDNPAASDIPGSSQLEDCRSGGTAPRSRRTSRCSPSRSRIARSRRCRVRACPAASPPPPSTTSTAAACRSRLLHPTGGDDDVLLFDDLA